jgi:hypothetical protein
MPSWLYRLRDIVWVAVGAFALALATIVVSLLGANLETVVALGASAIALAVLSQRS